MNPLRIDNQPGEDTCHLVRAVLAFMHDAFVAMEGAEMVSTSAMLGASQIMNLCADALKSADESERGES